MSRALTIGAIALVGVTPLLSLDATAKAEPTAIEETQVAPTTAVAPTNDEPTDMESWAALVAILGAIIVGAAVVVMVDRAHRAQEELAAAALARGTPVTSSTTSATASGGFEALVDALAITGPDRLVVGESGAYSVEASVENPTWRLSGITAYAQRLASAHELVLTPNEAIAELTVIVEAGTQIGQKTVKVDPAPKPPAFVIQLATRSWGLVVVATAVVFGAVALGLTGHLDGGNFVALVAPLAALLGVTSIREGRSEGGDDV